VATKWKDYVMDVAHIMNSPFHYIVAIIDEYNYHDGTRKFIKKVKLLGNKVKRFCVIKKWFYC